MSLHEFGRIQERLKSIADPIGFLSNLFAHAPVGFAVWTPDGSPLLTNAAFMEMFQVEPPPGYNVLEDDLLARTGMLNLFQRAFAGETVQVPTFWYDPRELNVVEVEGGRRVAMSMTIFPLFKPSGEIDFVAATYKDDTEIMLAQQRLEAEGDQLKALLAQMEQDAVERRRLTQERSRLEAQLRQSQKMEALGTLSGGIAHDFNNLLTAILGYTSLAQEDPEEAQHSLSEISRAAMRAADLVRQILAFGRPQEAERRAVQLQPAIEEALRLLRATLPAMVAIRHHLVVDLPDVLADTTQVHQVMMNLGTNAAHAMGSQGGLLEVRLEEVTVSEDLARTLATMRAGQYLRLTVADGGCGIEKEVVQRIFEPFFTTKAPGHGSGLGLSVVHGIMKAHDGAVTVYSEPGKGTTFHLYFPVTKAASEQVVRAPSAVPLGRGEHVLHVDDEEALTFLNRRILEDLGYRVTSHNDPSEALQDFRARPDEFDALVTDYSMQVMSGTALVARVREIRPELPTIMLSGYCRPEDVEAAHRAGVEELLMKPSGLGDLGRVLHRLLNRAA